MIVGGLLRTLSGSLVTPYLGLVLYNRGMPLYQVGAYYVLIALVGSFGSLAGGRASDALGRRSVMFTAQLISGFIISIMGASLLEFRGYAVFAALAPVQSFAGSASFSTFNTYVGDFTSGRGETIMGYARARIGINLGWAFGPLIGGVLAGVLGFSYAYIISGAALAVSSLYFLSFPNPAIRTAQSYPRASLEYLKLISPFILIYAFIAQFGLTLTVYEVSFAGLPVTFFGLIYLVNGLCVVAFQYPTAKAITKGGFIRWMGAGLTLYAIGFMFYALGGLVMALIGTAVLSMGENIVSPISMSVASLAARRDRRGGYMGAYSMLTSASRSIGSFIGSSLLGSLKSPFMVWPSIDGLGALAWAYFYIVYRKEAVALKGGA